MVKQTAKTESVPGQKAKGAKTMTATSTTPNGTTAKAGDIVNGAIVRRIPLADIHYDREFNVRTASFTGGTGDNGQEQGTVNGIESLVESILEAGQQDTPGLVRPTGTHGKGTKRPYLGVAGFRRSAALAKIAEGALAKTLKLPEGATFDRPLKNDKEWDPKTPTILVTVREMSDLEASLANLRENTVRDDLRAPDFAYGLKRLADQYAAEQGAKPKEGELARGASASLARGLGKNEAYVGRLLKIATALEKEPDVMADWRGSFAVTVHDMAELVKNPGPYKEQYFKLKPAAQVTETPLPGDDKGAEEKWLTSAKEKALEFGKALGIIAQHADNNAKEQGEEPPSIDAYVVWDEALLRSLFKFKKAGGKNGLTASDMTKIRNAAGRGVTAGRKEVVKALKDAEDAKNNDDGEKSGK